MGGVASPAGTPEILDLLNGMNSTGQIDWSIYSSLFDAAERSLARAKAEALREFVERYFTNGAKSLVAVALLDTANKYDHESPVRRQPDGEFTPTEDAIREHYVYPRVFQARNNPAEAESGFDRRMALVRAEAKAGGVADAVRVVEYIRGSYSRQGNNYALLTRVIAAVRSTVERECPVCGMTNLDKGDDSKVMQDWEDYHDDHCEGRWSDPSSEEGGIDG